MPRAPRFGRNGGRARIATLLLGAFLLAGAIAAPASATSTAPLTTLPTTPIPSTTTTPTTTQTGPVTVPTPTTTTTSSGGLTSAEEIAIFIAAAIVIAGIARIIVKDARSHTPTGAAPSIDRPKGTIAPIEHRLKRSRARAKRARKARRAGR